MQVELRPIGTIKPYENNPRLNDAGVDAVAASIREFGFRQPYSVYKTDPLLWIVGIEHTPVREAQPPRGDFQLARDCLA